MCIRIYLRYPGCACRLQYSLLQCHFGPADPRCLEVKDAYYWAPYDNCDYHLRVLKNSARRAERWATLGPPNYWLDSKPIRPTLENMRDLIDPELRKRAQDWAPDWIPGSPDANTSSESKSESKRSSLGNDDMKDPIDPEMWKRTEDDWVPASSETKSSSESKRTSPSNTGVNNLLVNPDMWKSDREWTLSSPRSSLSNEYMKALIDWEPASPETKTIDMVQKGSKGSKLTYSLTMDEMKDLLNPNKRGCWWD